MTRVRLGLLGTYLAAFLAASYLDLWTTGQALHHAGVSESNVYATSAGLYSASRAWLITAAGGAVMASLFAFGLRNAALVSETSLDHPLRSFSKFYLNPWSRRFIDRSPLHAISFALAFVLLRLLAAANNSVLMAGGVGPLGAAVRWVGRLTSPASGFVLTIGIVSVGLSVLLSPTAAALVRRVRTDQAKNGV